MTNEERDKTIRILQWLHDNKFLFRSTEEDVKYATKLAIQELQQEPSIASTEKIGHWIVTGRYYTGAYGFLDYVKCSCCHEDSLEEGSFCPFCGAKMK